MHVRMCSGSAVLCVDLDSRAGTACMPRHVFTCTALAAAAAQCPRGRPGTQLLRSTSLMLLPPMVYHPSTAPLAPVCAVHATAHRPIGKPGGADERPRTRARVHDPMSLALSHARCAQAAAHARTHRTSARPPHAHAPAGEAAARGRAGDIAMGDESVGGLCAMGALHMGRRAGIELSVQ